MNSRNRPKGKDLYVTDISFDADEEELRKLFSVCGTVRSIHLLQEKASGQFSGRAFVRMASEAEAKNAVNTLDGALLINRCIRVAAARNKSTDRPSTEQDEKRPPRRRPKRNRT